MIMAITVDATYEGGILKPAQPLPLQEYQNVRITVHTGVSRARQTAGLMGWTGSAELADRFALDPELDFPPPPEEP
jgi:predicted DNA-binding antitoxin AbrB/MazE fold protein